MNYPTSLDTSTTLPTEASGTPLATNHVVAHQGLADAVIALETKVGIDGSADTTTIDYKLKSTSQVDPGHKHSVSSLSATGGADNTKVLYGDNSWKVPPTTTNASASVIGVTKLTKNPAGDPIAIGANAATLSGSALDDTSNKIVDQAYAPETTGNKSTNATTDKASDTKYPSVKAITTYVDNQTTIYKNGQTTLSGAKNGGTQTIAHGLGKAPKFVRIFGMVLNTATVSHSFGSYNGTTNSNVHDYNGVVGSDSTYGIYLVTTSGVYVSQGVITFDATNITITWTTDGSGGNASGNINWEAVA